MPLGPLQLVDETSIDLGVKIAKATRAAMGDAYPRARWTRCCSRWPTSGGSAARPRRASTPTTRRASARASGRGCASSAAARRAARARRGAASARMIQALEAVRALEEGVLTDIREGDVGAILGWGFMPWSGGPFSWLDILGAERAVEICDTLAAASARASRPRRCCASWRRRARASTGVSGRSAPPICARAQRRASKGATHPGIQIPLSEC